MISDGKTTETTQEQTAQANRACQNTKSHQDARRRLLKAATIAPVIFTLPNGAALAATSSTCREDSVVLELTEQVDGDGNATGNLVGTDEKVYEAINPDDPNAGYYYDTKKFIPEDQNTLVAESCWSSLNPQTVGLTKHFQRIV